MSSGTIILKTVGGRHVTVPGPVAARQLCDQAALAFGFLPSSLRLIRAGSEVSEHHVINCNEEIVVVGSRGRRSFEEKAPVPGDRRTGIISPIVGDALPPAHCPDGLREILCFSLDVASPLLPVVLANHPTIEWMSNFISGDHSRLELVLRQCQRDCPAFVDWVRSHAQLFLQLVNREPVVADITVDFSPMMTGMDEFIILRENDESTDMDDDDDNEQEVVLLQQREKKLHDLMLNTSQPLVRMQAMAHVAASYRNRYERVGDCEEQATRYTRDAMSLGVDSYASFSDADDEIVDVFAAAERWFAERHPFSALVARIAHMLFQELCEEWTRCGWVRSVPDCFVEARRLCDYSKESSTTVLAMFPSYEVTSATLLYVICRGNVMVRSVLSSLDRLTAGADFLAALTVDGRREAVALRLWQERLVDLHHLFLEPVADLLPPFANAEMAADDQTPQLTFLTPSLKRPVPFAAFIDSRGIPLVAKFAVCQAFSFRSLVDRRELSGPAHSLFDVDGQQPWLTRSLMRAIGVGTRRINEPLTVLHISSCTNTSAERVADFTFFEKFTGSFPSVRSSALVRGMPCHEEPLPYEFLRTFYMLTSEGVTLARAVRQASLATAALFPGLPWAWASMMLLHNGGALRALNDAHKGKVRQIGLSEEARYCINKSIPEMYDVMVSCLVTEKPESEIAVLETLIECLCSKERELIQHLQRRSDSEGESLTTPPVGPSGTAA